MAFFDAPQGAAVLKHGILRRYLPVFATKASVNSDGRRVAFLDGYAGPGRYRDGTPGSPEIAMDVADAVAAYPTPRDMKCFFVEKEADLVAELEGLVEERGGQHVVRHGQVEEHLGEIADGLRGVPLFAFLDPFGLGMPLEQLAEVLLDRPAVVGGATEVLLNFNLTGLPRIGGLLTSDRAGQAGETTLARLDAVLGGPDWRDSWDPDDTEASSETLADLFCQQARKISNRGWGYFRAGVSDSWDGRDQYQLILLSAHHDGAWYFNEALSLSIDEFYEWCHPGQQTTDAPKLRKQEWIDTIASNLDRLLSQQGAISVRANMGEVYGETLGYARGLHIRAAAAVALVAPGVGALVRLGADRGGQLGLDQLLQRILQQPAEQLAGITFKVEPLQDIGQGIMLVGHRVTSPS